MRVWFETRPVADLMPGPLGPSMTYAPEWLSLGGAFPVSTRMPLRAAPYGPAEVIPWVVNLLPESQNLEALVRLTRIAEQDVLGLLDQIGRDTSGALSFARRGAPEMTCRPVPDDAALERIIDELPAKPFLVGEEGGSTSRRSVPDARASADTCLSSAMTGSSRGRSGAACIKRTTLKPSVFSRHQSTSATTAAHRGRNCATCSA